MKRLIVLSDVRGKSKNSWIENYTLLLKDHFEISYHDCRQLGGIPQDEQDKERLHAHFVNGGIERAVAQLLTKEKEAFTLLGFSIGGYIGWRACLAGLKVENIFAVSSTRLRYEKQKPSVGIELFYGGNDSFIPDMKWFEEMNLTRKIYDNETHELYTKKEIARDICGRLIERAQYNR